MVNVVGGDGLRHENKGQLQTTECSVSCAVLSCAILTQHTLITLASDNTESVSCAVLSGAILTQDTLITLTSDNTRSVSCTVLSCAILTQHTLITLTSDNRTVGQLCCSQRCPTTNLPCWCHIVYLQPPRQLSNNCEPAASRANSTPRSSAWYSHWQAGRG